MMTNDVKETAGEMAVYANKEKTTLLSFVQVLSFLGLIVLTAAVIAQLSFYKADDRMITALIFTMIGLLIMSVITLYVTGLLSRIVKNKAVKRIFMIALIVATLIPIVYIAALFILIAVVIFYPFVTKPKVYTDVSQYNEYIHNQGDQYPHCAGEWYEIFPKTVTDDMNVREFQYTYYDPWDAQYITYMTVAYSEKAYEAEVVRLQNIGVDNYEGIYSVTGAPAGYQLLAVNTDDYHGFIYAIIPENADGNSDEITYVGIDFCNYYLDLDIHKYLPDRYLLEGFDATNSNPYAIEHYKKINATK